MLNLYFRYSKHISCNPLMKFHLKVLVKVHMVWLWEVKVNGGREYFLFSWLFNSMWSEFHLFDVWFWLFGRFYVSWFTAFTLGSRSAYNEEVKYLASAKHLFIRSHSVVDFFLLLWLILFVLDVIGRIEGQPYHLLCRYYLFLAFHKNTNTHLRHIYWRGYIIKLCTR